VSRSGDKIVTYSTRVKRGPHPPYHGGRREGMKTTTKASAGVGTLLLIAAVVLLQMLAGGTPTGPAPAPSTAPGQTRPADRPQPGPSHRTQEPAASGDATIDDLF